MLLDALLLVFLVALLGGGRLQRLDSLQVRAPWVFVLALALQALALFAGVRGWTPLAQFAGPLYVLSYLMLLAAIALNHRLRPLWIAGLGLGLNLLVIAFNGGRMPVEVALVRRTGRPALIRLLNSKTKHAPAGPETRLRFLDDNLVLPPPYPNPQVFSVGDVFVTAGVCWLLFTGMGAFGLGKSGRKCATPGLNSSD